VSEKVRLKERKFELKSSEGSLKGLGTVLNGIKQEIHLKRNIVREALMNSRNALG